MCNNFPSFVTRFGGAQVEIEEWVMEVLPSQQCRSPGIQPDASPTGRNFIRMPPTPSVALIQAEFLTAFHKRRVTSFVSLQAGI